MKILSEKRTGTALTIKGEAVMLDKYGNVYNVIDNLMHPNPGTEDDEYSEIERPIDWLLSNNLYVKRCKDWIKNRVYKEMEDYPTSTVNEVLENVMYADLYDPCQLTKQSVQEAYNEYINDTEENIEKIVEEDELPIARDIATFINERFCRVRAGGKLNPEGANEIYFRISSHGYDWHRTIVDFLWDTFGSPNDMPNKIWIGHDAETNPPEIVLFYGTPQELLEKEDGKKFEQVKQNLSVQRDRESYRLNKKYMESISKVKKYISFK